MKSFKIGNVEIFWHGHDCFRIEYGKTIYTDPFRLKDDSPKADIILVTHGHFDHLSPEDIKKIVKDDTVMLVTPDCLSKLSKFIEKGKTISVKPGDVIKITDSIHIMPVRAYNTNKFRSPGVHFHPKENDWVGYIIKLGDFSIYMAGDSDSIPEMRQNVADLLLVPVSGTYVMTAEEAAKAANDLRPKYAIPMHYGSIVGTLEDAERFKSLCSVPVIILQPQ